MINLLNHEKISFLKSIGVVFLFFFISSCYESDDTCFGMNKFNNGNNKNCYINYIKDGKVGENNSGSAHFLYPIHELKNDIFTLEYVGSGKNIERSISSDMQGSSGKLIVIDNIASFSNIPIYISLDKYKNSWMSPDKKYKCNKKKIKVNYIITCISDKSQFQAEYSFISGLLSYEVPCQSGVCKYKLDGNYGIFSRNFFKFYKKLGIDFDVTMTGAKPILDHPLVGSDTASNSV